MRSSLEADSRMPVAHAAAAQLVARSEGSYPILAFLWKTY